MSVEPSEPQPDSVRASHADRERVVAILQDALAQGRITPDEYGERSATALEARTVGELRPILDDLPAGLAADDSVVAVGGSDVVEWRGSFSSLKRSGSWPVPARIVLRRRMGSVNLDFTQATFTSPVVDIDVEMVGGSIEIRLPDGASAAIDEVEVVLGSAEDHRKNAPLTGRPHIRLHGSVRWGSLEIRGPRKRMFN